MLTLCAPLEVHLQKEVTSADSPVLPAWQEELATGKAVCVTLEPLLRHTKRGALKMGKVPRDG